MNALFGSGASTDYLFSLPWSRVDHAARALAIRLRSNPSANPSPPTNQSLTAPPGTKPLSPGATLEAQRSPISPHRSGTAILAVSGPTGIATGVEVPNTLSTVAKSSLADKAKSAAGVRQFSPQCPTGTCVESYLVGTPAGGCGPGLGRRPERQRRPAPSPLRLNLFESGGCRGYFTFRPKVPALGEPGLFHPIMVLGPPA